MDDRPIRSLFQRQPDQTPPEGEVPGETDLTPEDQEKIQAAREVMSLLVKTYKAYRIYLSNNEILIRFQKELIEKFHQYLSPEHLECISASTSSGIGN